MLLLAGAQPHEPVPRTGQGVQHVERSTLFRHHETLHVPDETRIRDFQTFKIALPRVVFQRRAQQFHKTAILQKTQILRRVILMSFHFFILFVFCL